MKIKLEDIGVKEVPEDMKNAAIARKKAFDKARKKTIPAPKTKKEVAKVEKPATKKAKVVAAVKNVLTKKKKGNKHGKKNRGKNR